jgi:hypothetical protein
MRALPADDHVVDLDLDLGSGGLVVAGTGAVAADFVAVPAGEYRLLPKSPVFSAAPCAARRRAG